MEHMYFEAQLCVHILKFKDNSNYCHRSEGFPERDIWFLCVMDQSSCQIGRVLGTSSSSSPPPSPGRGTMFGTFKFDFDSYESSRNFETGVLHRILSRIHLAEWFGLWSHFGKCTKYQETQCHSKK